MSDVNGAGPEQLLGLATRTAELLDSVAADLRAQIAMEQAGRAEYETLVRDSIARERQLKRTLTTIEGQANTAGKREQRKKHEPGPVGEKSIAAVLAVLPSLPQPFSREQLNAALPDRSHETVRRALITLRDREQVRKAGQEGKGRTAKVLWALMPGAEQVGPSGGA